MSTITFHFYDSKKTKILPSMRIKNSNLKDFEQFFKEKDSDFTIEIYSNAFRVASLHAIGQLKSEILNFSIVNGVIDRKDNILSIHCHDVRVDEFSMPATIVCS